MRKRNRCNIESSKPNKEETLVKLRDAEDKLLDIALQTSIATGSIQSAFIDLIVENDRLIYAVSLDIERQLQSHIDSIVGITDDVRRPISQRISQVISEVAYVVSEIRSAMDNRFTAGTVRSEPADSEIDAGVSAYEQSETEKGDKDETEVWNPSRPQSNSSVDSQSQSNGMRLHSMRPLAETVAINDKDILGQFEGILEDGRVSSQKGPEQVDGKIYPQDCRSQAIIGGILPDEATFALPYLYAIKRGLSHDKALRLLAFVVENPSKSIAADVYRTTTRLDEKREE